MWYVPYIKAWLALVGRCYLIMCKVPVVFIFTDNFIVPAYIAIKSLIEKAGQETKYDIIILQHDLSKKHIQILKKLLYSSRHTIRFIKINMKQFENYPESKNWPSIVYIRLFLQDILKQYNKVLYLDIDVLFLGDLQGLYNLDIKDYEWAGVPVTVNEKGMKQFRYFDNNKNKYIYQSGIMLCNLEKMREIGFSDIIKKNVKKYSSDLLMFDLDILNMSTTKILSVPVRYSLISVLYETDNLRETYAYAYMKKIYSYKELEIEKKEAVMIHYAGGRGKPWKIMRPHKEYVPYLNTLPLTLKQEYIWDKYKGLTKNAFIACQNWKRKIIDGILC